MNTKLVSFSRWYMYIYNICYRFTYMYIQWSTMHQISQQCLTPSFTYCLLFFNLCKWKDRDQKAPENWRGQESFSQFRFFCLSAFSSASVNFNLSPKSLTSHCSTLATHLRECSLKMNSSWSRKSHFWFERSEGKPTTSHSALSSRPPWVNSEEHL